MNKILDESLPGVKVIQVPHFRDDRGYFEEVYRQPLYDALGVDVHFVQDNHSFSQKGVLRGMHFQSYPGQTKLITVLKGTIYDVFVDVRRSSPFYGKWGARELSAHTGEQLLIPNGYAHGFVVLSDGAHILYKVSSVYNPETELAFRYDDPEVGIEWPLKDPILSERDMDAPLLHQVAQLNEGPKTCRATCSSMHKGER